MAWFLLLLLRRASAAAREDCWIGASLEQQKTCCSMDDGSCFDEVFTKAECCSHNWAWRFPWQLSEEANFAKAFAWLQGARVAHPARQQKQLDWEAAMRTASKTLHWKMREHDMTLHYFKTSADVLSETLEYSESSDPHGFSRLQPIGTVSTERAAPIFALDIGANHGLVSIRLAKLWPKAKIVAVEPTPATFRYLLWNLKENHVAEQVWPLNLAISNAPSAVPMAYTASGSVWSARIGEDEASGAGSDDVFRAPTVTLPELLAALGAMGAIDLLKVDCEGCEYDILAKWELLRHRIRHVMMELHNGTFGEVVGISETARKDLEAKVLADPQLCFHVQEDMAGLKCFSWRQVMSLEAPQN